METFTNVKLIYKLRIVNYTFHADTSDEKWRTDIRVMKQTLKYMIIYIGILNIISSL